jgi:hypothetical protein
MQKVHQRVRLIVEIEEKTSNAQTAPGGLKMQSVQLCYVERVLCLAPSLNPEQTGVMYLHCKMSGLSCNPRIRTSGQNSPLLQNIQSKLQ